VEEEEDLEISMSNLWDLSHIQPQPSSVLDGDTIAAMFWNAVAQRGPDVWLRKKDLGIWRSWTWQQTGEAVREIAGGLMQLGFAAGDTASILSNTVVEWVMADLAVLSCGGVSNGIYPTDAASQVQYLCEDSRTSVLFVEDDEQLDKALEVRATAGPEEDRRVRHEGPARPGRRGRDQPGRSARAGS
jgi:long-chain acyl-CoA synthetase